MSEEGSVIVVVMMFAFVFLVLGTALFFMNRNSNAETHLERKDVKAFNVAEAGVDAAMVALKTSWPRSASETVAVDPTEFRDNGFSDTHEYPEPTHGQFINSLTYDDTDDNPTTEAASRVFYDSNGNDIMWVDSEALVDNARHRILVKVQRLKMPVEIPDVALVASTAGGNGQGLAVEVDPAYAGSIPEGGADAWYTGLIGKGINKGDDIELIEVPPGDDPFSEKVPDALIGMLKQMAMNADPGSPYDDTYFDDSEGADEVSDFLCSAKAPGSIVYFETSVPNGSEVQIGGNSDMGSPEKPVVLIVDARNATNPIIDWRGTSAFYGVLIVIGDALLRGTNDIFGCVLSNGAVENKGGPGVKYNGDYIRKVNEMHTLSVAMVPNSWEEYTIAAASPATTTTDTTTP
ncbi:MAG: hypothetical protein JW990_15835 [Thermoleophilia bacterium]|nr:hypothetical protein [Thermoleophilia bacterium]